MIDEAKNANAQEKETRCYRAMPVSRSGLAPLRRAGPKSLVGGRHQSRQVASPNGKLGTRNTGGKPRITQNLARWPSYGFSTTVALRSACVASRSIMVFSRNSLMPPTPLGPVHMVVEVCVA